MNNGPSQLVKIISKFCNGAIHRDELLQAWATLERDLKIQDLLVQFNGIPLLWLVADAVSKGAPEVFLCIWHKFGRDLPLEIFLQPITKSEDEGTSALWLLAFAASDHHQPFMQLWEEHKQSIPLEALFTQAKKGPHRGIFALWSLADAATRGKAAAFEAVWDIIKSKIKADCLTMPVLASGDRGLTVLQLLIFAIKQGEIKLSLITDEMLTQVPGIIMGKALHSLEEVVGVTGAALVYARNTFFRGLERASKFTIDSYKLRTLAEKALTAGYLNAFNDLAAFYRKFGLYKNKMACYARVPEQSWHYQTAIRSEVNHFYRLALNERNFVERNCYLQEAFRYAVQLKDLKLKKSYMQRLAKLYAAADFVPVQLIKRLCVATDNLSCINLMEEYLILKVDDEDSPLFPNYLTFLPSYHSASRNEDNFPDLPRVASFKSSLYPHLTSSKE